MMFWGLATVLLMATSARRAELLECEARREECEMALERVPPAVFKRLYDELAECRQHLEEEADARPRDRSSSIRVGSEGA